MRYWRNHFDKAYFSLSNTLKEFKILRSFRTLENDDSKSHYILNCQSFSALKSFGSDRARAQPENLRSRSRSIFSRPCALARAQNVLSAAQFCAHFRILESFQFTIIQQFFANRQAFMGNISLILKNYVSYRKMS